MVATAIIQIMTIVWATFLGALSRSNAILIPRISAHPPILTQCKVHCPWALFHKGTVYDIVGCYLGKLVTGYSPIGVRCLILLLASFTVQQFY